ncbi:Transposase [Oopsacas minuta]|uniref:Transposase n=1 Tax=Oopsacas minuta TaxID=111878 RepID=A0AAV7JSY7_9METZ|nr:Transposase [Oopsacas minuta]
MVYIRYRDECRIGEEMLFYSPLETRTRGVDIFNMIDKFFTSTDVDLYWTDCIAVSTDGAPAMVGINRGFVALGEERKPKNHVHTLHDSPTGIGCERIGPDLEQLMKDVTKIINLIKAQPLTSRCSANSVMKQIRSLYFALIQ